MALFFGGLAQFLAGMWEFATGNTFGATGESGTFRSISLHHTQVMAASAIIKTWTICHRMILCRALLRASQSAAYFNADLGAEAYPRLVAARLCTRCLANYLFLWAAFTSYGAFWLSFATLLIPSSGVGDAYGSDAGMEFDAIGIYLISWMIVTFLFL